MSNQLSSESAAVIKSCINDLFPPTNPSVLLAAAREWYLAYGAGGPVWIVLLTRLLEVSSIYLNDIDLIANLGEARKIFEENTNGQVLC
jgi:hypothetical protein